MQDIEIFEAKALQPGLLTDLNALIEQLSTTAKPMAASDLGRIVESVASHLYLASIDGKAVGMCTLAIYDAPTGRKAWIEDVAVDNAFRGHGIGRRLIGHAIDEARKHAPCTLMLTSRPARVAANALYQSMAFARKETNVYKMELWQRPT